MEVLSNLQQQLTTVNQIYQNAITAQRNGDWAQYGKDIEELGRRLTALQEQTSNSEEDTEGDGQ